MLLKLYIGTILLFMSAPHIHTILQPPTDQAPVGAPYTHIAFASDTQAPLWVERLMLKAHRNRTATRLIFDDIISKKPIALFLLGDVVSWGSSNRAWSRVERYLDSARKKGIELYGTMGNHELMGIRGMRDKAQKTFRKQFPEYRKTGFAQVVDSIGVILLNSNFSALSKQEDSAQQDWYDKTLKQMDADPAIQYIITGCHHSPFTNSRIVGQNKIVQQKFVQPFFAAKKTCLFLSGHAHAFEYFERRGKKFLVIGGGGGVHQPLRLGAGDLTDLAATYKPMFHYLMVEKRETSLDIISYQLENNFEVFTPGKTITIDLPK